MRDGREFLTIVSALFAAAILAFSERFVAFLRGCAAFTVALEVAAVSDCRTGGCEHGTSSPRLGARLEAARVTAAILPTKLRIVLRVEGEGGGGQESKPGLFCSGAQVRSLGDRTECAQDCVGTGTRSAPSQGP